MAENEVFHAVIAASDDASHTIDQIKAKLHGLGLEAAHTGEMTEHLHHPHVFAALSEHVDLVHEHFGHLHASIGEVGGSIAELIPQFAAFAAIGSVAAVFETVEHTAEAYGELAHTAQSLGLATEQLHELNLVAKLTDTSVEAMDKGFSKLNRTIADASAGKNKDAAALFSHVGIALRDGNGHLRSANDLFPLLANAFAHTSDAAMRTRMSFALFGRGGAELIPMLMRGQKGIEELQREARSFGVDMSAYGEGLEAYNDSMHHLTIATGGFTEMLGGKLAPVLRPLIDEAADLVVANREWITGDIAEGVKEFSGWLQHVPWHQVGTELRDAGKEARHFIDDLGGVKVVAEVLGGVLAFKGLKFLAEPILDAAKFGLALGNLVLKLTTELVPAWAKVGTAAEVAGAKELAAAEAPGAAAIAGGSKLAKVATVAGEAGLGAAEGGVAVAAAGEGAAVIAGSSVAAALELIPPVLIGTLAIAALAASGASLAVFLREHFGGAPVDAEHPSLHVVTHAAIANRELVADRGSELAAQQRTAARLANRSYSTGGLARTVDAFVNSPGNLATPDDYGLPFAGSPLPPPPSATRSPAPAADVTGEVKISIDFTNAPPGTTTSAAVTGSPLISPRINTGRAWDLDPFAS